MAQEVYHNPIAERVNGILKEAKEIFILYSIVNL